MEKTYKGRKIEVFNGADTGNEGWYWQVKHLKHSTYTDPSGPYRTSDDALKSAKANIDAGNCD